MFWLAVSCDGGAVEPVVGPISARARTVACGQGGELTILGLCTVVHPVERESTVSVDVLQATGSLLLHILFVLCCVAVLFYRLDFCANGESLYCETSFSVSPSQLVCYVNSGHSTVNVHVMMAEGDRPSGDRSGVLFRDVLHTSWNAPESFVTFTSPEVIELDISVVPDVLGLRTRDSKAAVICVTG